MSRKEPQSLRQTDYINYKYRGSFHLINDPDQKNVELNTIKDHIRTLMVNDIRDQEVYNTLIEDTLSKVSFIGTLAANFNNDRGLSQTTKCDDSEVLIDSFFDEYMVDNLIDTFYRGTRAKTTNLRQAKVNLAIAYKKAAEDLLYKIYYYKICEQTNVD